MRKRIFTLAFLLVSSIVGYAQGIPEILYYKFDGTGSSVPNEASSPPAGTATGTLLGTFSQGMTGMCGGALVSGGGAGATDYFSTGWATDLSGSWTISFWSSRINIACGGAVHYGFGDSGASFRCFTGGSAGEDNWLLQGYFPDVIAYGGAGRMPHMTTFVYDSAAASFFAYVDGELVNTVPYAPVTISTVGPFKIGSYGTNTSSLVANGLMDEFRLYSRALDANEIKLVYSQCLPLIPVVNDAGVVGPVEPYEEYCPGAQTIKVAIRNHGTAQLSSCVVNWEWNGVPQTPVPWTGSLDVYGSAGAQMDTVTLGVKTFTGGQEQVIKAWTSQPNGVADVAANNDTMTHYSQPSLTGTYTIGGAGADFINFNDAVNSLHTYGICGPVVFNVYDSVYNEQIAIDAICGSSAINTVTFQAVSGMPEMQFDPYQVGPNHIVQLLRATYILFDGIRFNNTSSTYGTVVNAAGKTHHISFKNCEFISNSTNDISNSRAVIKSQYGVDSVYTFENNFISGGSFAFYWRGSVSSGISAKDIVIRNNVIEDVYLHGIFSTNNENLIFEDNHITFTTTSFTSSCGVKLDYMDSTLRVVGNYIGRGSGTISPAQGIVITNFAPSQSGSALIANNMVQTSGSNSTVNHGIQVGVSDKVGVYHNSINIVSYNSSSEGMLIGAGQSNIDVRNNCVKIFGGVAIYVGGTGVNYSIDYNNLYTLGTNVAKFTGSTYYSTLAAYSAATGFDSNSISVDPLYFSNFDLHICSQDLEGAGAPLSTLVPEDYDSDIRNVLTPDIGADEFWGQLGASFLGPDQALMCGDSILLSLNTGATDTIVWNDGSSSSSRWIHTPGQYSVTVNGACGVSSDTIMINGGSVVYSNFLQADTTVACAGDTVHLSTTMPFTTYAWNTGASSANLNVTSGGTYILTGSDSCGSGSDTVSVTFLSQPNAGFSVAPVGLDAYFTNSSTGSGTLGFSWDFGDGNTSTAANPTHTYAQSGTYNACLTVTNVCGSDQYCGTVTINCPTPTVSYSFVIGPQGQVDFTNGSSLASSYSWDFGDGGTSTAANPTHIYTTPSSYSACLTATNSCGSSMYCDLIHVTCFLPTAEFTYVNQGAGQVQFTNLMTGASNYSWDFDDGSTSASVSPSHTFASTGTYNVCATVTDSCGSNTYCESISVTVTNVSAPAITDFTVVPNPAQDLLTIKAGIPKASNMNLSLFNAIGQVVYQTETFVEAGDFEMKVNLEGLSSGVYMLRAVIGSQESVVRIIKE